MKRTNSTKAQLCEELTQLRRRVAELETAEEARKRAERALRESEARYRGVVEDQTELICRYRIDGTIVFVNEAYCRYFGKSRDELVGRCFVPLVPKEDQDRVQQHFASLDADNPVGTHEHRVIAANGETRWQQWTNRAITDESGRVVEFQGAGRDITERKEAEDALRESEARYRAIFGAIGDGMVVHDDGGVIIDANEVTCSRLGRAIGELRGMNIRELITGEHAPLVSEHVQKARTKGSSAFETVFVHKSGRAIPCDVFEQPIEYGGQAAILSVARDITERKRAERELEALLRLHQSTTATMPSSLLVLDAGLNVLMANQHYLEESGVGAAEVVGKNIADVFPASLLAQESLLERIRSVAGVGGQDEELGIRLPSSDSPNRCLNIRVRGIRALDRGQPAVLVVIDDVTQQRKLEEQLRQSAKMEAVGKLAGGIAHDFNNVLTGITGYTHFLLRDAASGSDATRDLTRIRELADRAASLTAQLLAFSRKQPLSPVPLDLNAFVKGMLDLLRRLTYESIELAFAAAADLGTVRVDPGQFEQVLLNLVVNARDAMPNGGELTIETANVTFDEGYAKGHAQVSPGPYVLLAVSDSGCGMDEETRERIFEPFFTTKEMGKGTGLGLATVYGIVKQHGGHVWVYSEVGQGTTFKIYLPRVDVEAQALPVRDEGTSVPRGAETILVVEDDAAVLGIVQRVLEAKGYQVLSAANPDEAEAMIEERGGQFALLLTDLVMPGRSGQELFQRLAAERPSLKVLYMSGYTDNTIMHQGVLEPGAAFIQKPFGPDALARKVREVLDT